MEYTEKLFSFLVLRTLLVQLPFEFFFFYFYGPAHLWNFYLYQFNFWGLCERNGGWDVQLLCGLFCGVTYRAVEIALFTPASAYQTWAIEKVYNQADPTVSQFILSRLAMLAEFVLMVMPVALLVVKVMQWTGDYLVLVFFLCTSAVTISIRLVYPRLIEPLFSTHEELPEWMSPLRFHIVYEAESAGFGGARDIYLERSNFNDMHANASA